MIDLNAQPGPGPCRCPVPRFRSIIAHTSQDHIRAPLIVIGQLEQASLRCGTFFVRSRITAEQRSAARARRADHQLTVHNAQPSLVSRLKLIYTVAHTGSTWVRPPSLLAKGLDSGPFPRALPLPGPL